MLDNTKHALGLGSHVPVGVNPPAQVPYTPIAWHKRLHQWAMHCAGAGGVNAPAPGSHRPHTQPRLPPFCPPEHKSGSQRSWGRMHRCTLCCTSVSSMVNVLGSWKAGCIHLHWCNAGCSGAYGWMNLPLILLTWRFEILEHELFDSLYFP